MAFNDILYDKRDGIATIGFAGDVRAATAGMDSDKMPGSPSRRKRDISFVSIAGIRSSFNLRASRRARS